MILIILLMICSFLFNEKDVSFFMTNNAIDYLKYMYTGSQGYISRATIRETYKQWHYDCMDIVEQPYLKEPDVYVSMNTFYKPQRNINNVKRLNALYVDIDCYKIGLTKEQVIWTLEQDYFGIKMPKPTFIIDSGRGIYLVWKIDEDRNAMPRWNLVMKYFHNQLRDFGADMGCKEPSRILRVPGSINSKSGTSVSIIDFYDYKYTLYEIIQEYLPDASDAGRTKQKKKSNIYSFNGKNDFSTVLSGRLHDLEILFSNRNSEDCRENALFLYRLWMCELTHDYQFALDKTLEFNRKMKYPHTEKYVIQRTKSAETRVKAGLTYKYSKNRIIEMLGITEEEEKNLAYLRDIGLSKEDKRSNKKSRNQAAYIKKLEQSGKQKKSCQINKRRQLIEQLIEQGYSRTDICEKLNISNATYHRDYAVILSQIAVNAIEASTKGIIAISKNAALNAVRTIKAAKITVKKSWHNFLKPLLPKSLKNSASSFMGRSPASGFLSRGYFLQPSYSFLC